MNPETHSPNDELDLAIEDALAWYDAMPELDIVTSNHDARIIRKAHAGGLPARVLKSFGEIVQSPPGWRWEQDMIEVDGFVIVHGDGLNASSSKTAYNRLKQSVVHGHTHQGLGCNYSQSRKNRLFSLNVGALIDARQKAFDYARFSHERATLGLGVVIDGDQAVAIAMPEKLQRQLT